MIRSVLGIVLGALLACGVGCGGMEITEQPLQGKIGGQSWTFVTGYTDDFLSDEQEFFAVLYAEQVDACGFGGAGLSHIILSLPTQIGEWDLGLSRTMTFVDYDADGVMNNIALDGVIRVDGITDRALTGAVHAKFDDGNEVDGKFVISICPLD